MENYYNQIKEQLINNEINNKIKNYSINKSDLETYYNVGKLLIEAQGGEMRAKYGNSLIKEYSKRLTSELGKGYSPMSLKYMRKFYLFQKRQPLVVQLSWSHYTILMSLNDDNKISYYIDQCIKYNLSKRKLIEKIKSNEYERLPIETKNKLINNKESKIADFIKNPIIIKNNLNVDKISEKILQKLILEDIPSFLEQLGDGFTFTKNEYPIKLGNIYNYIDLLLFNIKYNCYVVVELKITSLKKEHIGQIETYMNYIDKHIKEITHDKTIGIIITKQGNDFVMEYCSDKRIYDTTYLLSR